MLKKSKMILMIFLLSMSSISLASVKTCDQLLDQCASVVVKQKKAIEMQQEVSKNDSKRIKSLEKENKNIKENSKKNSTLLIIWNTILTLVILL